MNSLIEEINTFFEEAEKLVIGKTSDIDEFNLFIQKAEELLEEKSLMLRDELIGGFKQFIEQAEELISDDQRLEDRFKKFTDEGKEMLINEGRNKLEFIKKNELEIPIEINFLEIFGIKRKEIPHSSFLAWLLNPESPHNLGNLFLREFMKIVSEKHCTKYNLEFEGVEIQQEKSGEISVPDIKIISKNFLCIIENKIISREGKDQTDRLHSDAQKELMKRGLSKDQLFLVYLSPSKGNSPKNEFFIHMIYQEIIDILNKILKKDLNLEVRIIIKHFIFNLEYNILKKYELNKRANLILKRYRSCSNQKDFIISNYYEIVEIYQKIKSEGER